MPTQEKEAKPELKGYNRRSWMNWLTGTSTCFPALAHDKDKICKIPEIFTIDIPHDFIMHIGLFSAHMCGIAWHSRG